MAKAVGIFEFPAGDGTTLFKIGEDATHAKTNYGFKTRLDAEVALKEVKTPTFDTNPKKVAKPVVEEPVQTVEPVTGEQI